MKKHTISFILALIIISSLMLSVVAASSNTPYYNNTASTSTSFAISSSGKATISAVYNGHRTLTTGARITSYIEKRTLGIFWSKVDIGQPNDEWVDTSSDYLGAFVHEFNLSDKGTYRATVVYEISGTGGATDVIDYEQERTYS